MWRVFCHYKLIELELPGPFLIREKRQRQRRRQFSCGLRRWQEGSIYIVSTACNSNWRLTVSDFQPYRAEVAIKRKSSFITILLSRWIKIKADIMTMWQGMILSVCRPETRISSFSNLLPSHVLMKAARWAMEPKIIPGWSLWVSFRTRIVDTATINRAKADLTNGRLTCKYSLASWIVVELSFKTAVLLFVYAHKTLFAS